MKAILFFLLLVFFQLEIAFSQSTNSINQVSGVIVDGKDETPLFNAYVYLKNFPSYSTVSNSEGFFALRFPPSVNSDTVIISLLGYSKIHFPISKFDAFQGEIRLNQVTINLSEVIVKPDDKSLEIFLSKAIDKIEDNYPNKKHELSGLYRKVSFNYSDFTNLIEASVTVQDVGYQKPTDFLRFRIDELRQGDDLEIADSSFIYLKERIRESIKKGGVDPKSLNDLISTYNDNFIRIAYEPKTYFGKDGGKFLGIPELPMYHELMGEEIIGKDTIYQISFSNQDPPSGRSYLKINTRNHAIVEYQMDVLNGDFQVFVKFQEYQNRYYPEKIELRTLRFVNWDVGNHNMDIHTFIFDSLKTERIKKISKKESQKVGEKISGQEFEFHPEFWSNYDLVKKHPLDSAIIRSLERFKSLKEQFKSNGKK